MSETSETTFPTTERSRIRRIHERGSHEKESVYSILDAAPMCHVGYVIDGQPLVTPTVHWRNGNRVYWHGSAASRFLRKSLGQEVCLTVSIMDGYILGRSAFSHSVQFRSAMCFGKVQIVEDPGEKKAALKDFVDNLFPGRWEELHITTEQEYKSTKVAFMEIDEATSKTRDGFPNDAHVAHQPAWGGYIPVETYLGEPKPSPDLVEGVELPGYLNTLVQSGKLRA